MIKHWWTRALLGRTAVSNPLQGDENPSPQFEAEWRDLVKQRLLLIVALLGLWVVGIEARLVWVQVLDHDDWKKLADKQQADIEPIHGPRGTILDRDGRLLAGSVGSIEVHIDLNEMRKAIAADKNRKVPLVSDTQRFARNLCAALGDCASDEEATILARLDRPKAADALIRRARQMSPDAVAGLDLLMASFTKALKKEQGIITTRAVDLRFYPNITLAAQVIGYASWVDKNGKEQPTITGLLGVEKKFDVQLRGTPGTQFAQRDGKSRDMVTSVIKAPKPGTSLELTISSPLQEIAERALSEGVHDAGALGGTAIVLDSMTGEILAMANAPMFDLNDPGSVLEGHVNRAVQDLYEPGSTFKIVTLSAALNEGVISTHSVFSTFGGRFMVAGRPTPIKEDKGHDYGSLDTQGILVRSSNIGAAQVGLKLGDKLMLKYAREFGIGVPSATDFSTGSGGIFVPPRGLPDASLATVAYGYGVNATPVQIVSAMNVFATGGLLMRPHLIRATIENGIRKVQEPEVLGRVVSPETAATMISMLEAVVTDPAGTGHSAALARFQVAGKTGTTAKLVDGKYSTTDYRVSFAGIVPSRHPRFSIIVVVDRPTKKSAYGGAVAAPIFKKIAEESLQYVGEMPSINPAPPVVLPENRTPVKPVAPRSMDGAGVVVNANGVATMPNLIGLTLREAIRRLPPGVTLEDAQGGGVVVFQLPAAGEVVTPNTRATLRAQPGGGR